MVIRKLFKFEGSHIVRNCTSKRCSHSIHGHSYLVELFLSARQLDNAGMVVDFGLMGCFKDFVDLFDHTHLLWSKDKDEYRSFIKNENARWIELNCNPSAENIARVFHHYFNTLLNKMCFNNGEDTASLLVKSVRVHETATGYAETDEYDRMFIDNVYITNVSAELNDTNIMRIIKNDIVTINNPEVELQVK